MVELFNGISFSNKNEKNTDTQYKINEPWKHAKWKEPVTKCTYVIPFVENVQNKQIHRDREQIYWCHRLQCWGKNGNKNSTVLEERWRCLKLDHGNGCTTLWYILKPQNCEL